MEVTAIRHPECDLRPLLDRRPGVVSAYGAQRIRASYDNVEQVLAHCPGVGLGSALDVGSGAGYETFGLGTRFDRVVALDASRVMLWRAQRVARAAKVDRIEFRRADAERDDPGGEFSLVFAKVMSHSGRSRRALIDRLVAAAEPGGWIYYSEETEGYAPEEIHKAVWGRDHAALRDRLRQVLTACTGRTGFRFFVAGTATDLLEARGLAVHRRSTKSWEGLTTLDELWCRVPAEGASTAEGEDDPDYSSLPDELAELRAWFQGYLGSSGALGGAAGAEIEDRAREHPNRLAPFLLYLLMVDRVLGPGDYATGKLERTRRRGPAWAQPRDPDWGYIEHVDELFLAAQRERSGAAAASA